LHNASTAVLKASPYVPVLKARCFPHSTLTPTATASPTRQHPHLYGSPKPAACIFLASTLKPLGKKKDGFQWPILYIILVQGGEERKKRGAALAAFMLREIVNHPSGYIQHHFKFSAGVVTKSIGAAWP
jgi:hypothetical protein